MTSDRLVVGAIIVDSLEMPTRVLAARRTGPPELAGMWEFPGGKVEDGELPEPALIREIQEELSVTVRVGLELPHPVGGVWPAAGGYVMRLFYAVLVAGQPRLGVSHDRIRWLKKDDLYSVDWLPSDHASLRDVEVAMLGAVTRPGSSR